MAEGVETQDQLDIMSTLGCSEFQGYFISKPLPVAELTEFLRQPRPFTSSAGSDNLDPPKHAGSAAAG